MIIFETTAIIFIWKTINALISEMMAILTEKQLKKLEEHKYKREGGYTLLEPFMQPFWTWVVENLCPSWLAPNAITFIGLMINIFTALIIVFYNPDNLHSNKAPMWAYFTAAAGVFIYQTMDAIDGKQARKTNTSSPLGELFDHGCDAVSAVVLTTAALIHCRLHHDYLMFLVCGSFMAFYLAHWVGYCVGGLSFGKIDVVEIQFLMIFGFLISGCFGEDIWLTKLPVVEIELNMVLVIVIVIGGVLQAVPAFHTIFVKGGVGRNGSTVAGTSVLFPALPILTVLILTVMIAKKSEQSGDIYTYYPCLYLFAFGFVFAKVTCKLIVAHMCKSELEYWDSVYCGPALLFMNQYFDFFFPEPYVLWVSLVYNILNLLYYSHALSNQICRHLGIYCFSISKRPVAVDSSSNLSTSKSTSRSTVGVTTRKQASSTKKIDKKLN